MDFLGITFVCFATVSCSFVCNNSVACYCGEEIMSLTLNYWPDSNIFSYKH